MTDHPDAPAAASPLTAGRLLVTALMVALLASIAASLITSFGILIPSGGTGGENDAFDVLAGVLFITFFASLVSFLVVLASLLLLALPLTLILDRRGVGARSRNIVLLAVAAAVGALLFWAQYGGDPTGAWIFPTYALVAAILWVLALNRIERREGRFGAGLTARTSAAVFD